MFSSGAGVARSGAMGTYRGRVTMTDNGIDLQVGDGTSTSYACALTEGAALAAVPADCPGGHVTSQDGYFINTVPGTNRFQISDLNSLTYDALDTGSKEGRADELVMALSVNRQLWLFGRQTTEVWWNSGNPDFPFERIEGAFIETGTVAAGTCVRAGASVAWVGSDERGRGTVWHAQGTVPQRISTHAVELALSGYARLEEASAFAYQQRGHEFYVVTVPDGGTWAYDFLTGEWHERSYQDAEEGEQPDRAWVAAVAFGQVVAGDREDGRLYALDIDYGSDDGDPIRRLRQTAASSQDEHRIQFDSFQLQCEPGAGLASGQGSAPVAWLSWSNNGGKTWSNEHQVSLGVMGAYENRAIWRRLGVGRDRVWRVAMSDPVQMTWLGAEVEMVELDA